MNSDPPAMSEGGSPTESRGEFVLSVERQSRVALEGAACNSDPPAMPERAERRVRPAL